MDPVANLNEQRELAAKIIALLDSASSDQWADEQDRADWFEDLARQGERLAELVQALDGWRRKGGFDPYGAA